MTGGRNLEYLALAGIALLAIALRFVAIDAHLAFDDGFSYIVASAPNADAFLERLAATENTPPLFYLLLSPLPLEHGAWLRMPAAIPGALMPLALYAAVRRPLGVRTALLAALAVAVAPLLVSYSNVSRAFMLEDLALLVALWAILRLLDGGSARWWGVYVSAGVVAIYSEYDAAIFLGALTAMALWLRIPQPRRALFLGLLPVLALVPWIPQILRGQDAMDITKRAPPFDSTSLTTLRDAVASLALGEKGGTSNATARWLMLALVLALVGGAIVVLRRAWPALDSRARQAIVLIAGAGALTFAGHAIVGVSDIALFNQRYLTILIAVVAALGAAAVVAAGRPSLIAATALLLVVLGLGGIVRRYGDNWEPDPAPVRSAAVALQPRTVLTNSPVVVHDLRALRPQLDRPFNLGRGHAASCARPCLIIDDTRVRGTPRTVTGSQTVIRPYVLTLRR